MPTTSWRTIRDEISEEFGFVGFDTTTAIAANQLVVSTSLQSRFVYDDFFIDWWAMAATGASSGTVSDVNVGKIRHVNDYAATTGTLTVAGPALTAATGNTEMKLYRVHPDDLRRYFNRARQDLFPSIALQRDHQTIVTGQIQQTYTLPSTLRRGPTRIYIGKRPTASTVAENEVTDPGFENWTDSTTPASWTLSGTGASVTQEEETTNPKNYMVLDDASSARVLAASSNAATLLQNVTPSVGVEGVEANFSIWVYCMTSGRVSARCGSTDGSTHGGTGWELLTSTENTGTGLSQFITVGISVSAGAVLIAYVDEAILIVGQSEPVDVGWEPVMNWEWVPPVAGASNGGFLEFPFRLPEKHRLRILGLDLLSSVTADTDTVEIDGEQLDIIYNSTKQKVALALAQGGRTEERDFYRSEALRFMALVEEGLTRGNGTHPKRRLKIPDWWL